MNKRFIYWVGLMVFMSVTVRRSNCLHPMHNKLSQFEEAGTKWALLVAGSTGYSNYRHQADVCHAYQVLKNGGLKDENIIVMMYDDIAYNEQNPWPGVIINQPDGPNVYIGVPKVCIYFNFSILSYLCFLFFFLNWCFTHLLLGKETNFIFST